MQKHLQKLQMVEYNAGIKSRSTSQLKSAVHKILQTAQNNIRQYSITHAVYTLRYNCHVLNKY